MPHVLAEYLAGFFVLKLHKDISDSWLLLPLAFWKTHIRSCTPGALKAMLLCTLSSSHCGLFPLLHKLQTWAVFFVLNSTQVLLYFWAQHTFHTLLQGYSNSMHWSILTSDDMGGKIHLQAFRKALVTLVDLLQEEMIWCVWSKNWWNFLSRCSGVQRGWTPYCFWLLKIFHCFPKAPSYS